MGPVGEYLLHGIFGVAGLWLSVIDAREHRLPNLGTGALFVAVGGLCLGVVVCGAAEPSRMTMALVASVVSSGLCALLAVIPPGSLGFGDVKLQAGLGLYLGWLDPVLVVGQVCGAFFLGGVGAVWQIIRGKMLANDHLAFGPFMIAATAGMVWLGKSVEII